MSFTHEKFDMYSDTAARYGLKSQWSMYEVEDFDAPSGITADVLEYSSHWGPDLVEVQLPCGMKTWADLYKAADKAIRESGDEHHTFIEDLVIRDGRVHLYTGS